jgi:IS30 family transposase
MTAKKYTEELAEWVQKKKSTRPRSIAKISFLALKKDIEEALSSGFTMLMIWEHLRETKRLTVSYNTFTKYVSSHITNKKTEIEKKPEQKPVPQVALPKTKAVTPAAKPMREKGAGFTFDPTPKPEDLL